MVKDRLIVRMVFSGALIGFGLLNMVYVLFSRLFYKLKIRKDLHDIRDHDISKIMEEDTQTTNNEDIDTTKEEVNKLLKDIYFNLYNKQKDNQEITDTYTDIESSIDRVLDNSILNIIEEKEKLLQEKDRLINILEEKNEKFIDDTVTKITYIVQEKDRLIIEKEAIISHKDKQIANLESQLNKTNNISPDKLSLIIEEKNKLIKEKDQIISTLYSRIQQEKLIPQPTNFTTGGTGNSCPVFSGQTKAEPVYHHRDTFINVND